MAAPPARFCAVYQIRVTNAPARTPPWSPCPNYPKSKPPAAASSRISSAGASPDWWSVSADCAGRCRATLDRALPGQIIRGVRRRGKYLLLDTDAGTAILHLGMSGSLRLVPRDTPVGKHDHVDILLDSGQSLRLTDPRRFGALLWTTQPVETHELLVELGPEPLSDGFDGYYLFDAARGRKSPVKHFIMDSHIVVGVGNIYANEALFMAGIHPTRPAGRIARERYEALAEAIKQVFAASIKMGGTTLRDFVGSDGKPGYFKQTLRVYDRLGEPCLQCGAPIRGKRIGQRSSFYCVQCQR